MLATTTIHEEITEKIVAAIEHGQIPPPWRKPWRPDLEISGFPGDPYPFTGIAVLLLNMAATERGLKSSFWQTQAAWEKLGRQVSGEGTMIPSRLDPNRWITVFNADQVAGGLFRSRPRRTPLTEDYGPAEALIAACQKNGADICQVWETKAEYHYPPADRIIFPYRELFLAGPGGLPAYFDSFFHELAHWSEPRLGFSADYPTCELRSEIAAPFLASRLGIPVLCDMDKLPNHRNHLARWITAMHDDPTLIFNVAADASEAVEYLLSLRSA